MQVLGYGIGEIKAEAAMTSDIIMREDVPFNVLNDYVEIERRTMDVRPGMNRKYTPFMYSPITGGPLCGGRYVFDTWERVQTYFKWTQEELEFEPGIKFWDREIFGKVDKHIWKVAGAHDFAPVETHGVNRFERWSYAAEPKDAHRILKELWPTLREKAREAMLGTAWLLDQPDEKKLAIFVTGQDAQKDQDVEKLASSVDRLARMRSLGDLLPTELGLQKLFDRTSPIFSTWLPLSRQLGGAPVANPSSPAWPLPTVAPQAI